MQNKTLGIIVAAALLVGCFLGYAVVPSLFGSTTINYSSSLSQTKLYNNLASLLTDIGAVRTSVVAISSSTSMGASSLALEGASTSSASTTITGFTGVTVGDFVVCGESSSTASIMLTCHVSAANVVTVYKHNMDPTATVVAVTSTVYAKVFPRASFGAPAALNTVTSTSN